MPLPAKPDVVSFVSPPPHPPTTEAIPSAIPTLTRAIARERTKSSSSPTPDRPTRTPAYPDPTGLLNVGPWLRQLGDGRRPFPTPRAAPPVRHARNDCAANEGQPRRRVDTPRGKVAGVKHRDPHPHRHLDAGVPAGAVRGGPSPAPAGRRGDSRKGCRAHYDDVQRRAVFLGYAYQPVRRFGRPIRDRRRRARRTARQSGPAGSTNGGLRALFVAAGLQHQGVGGPCSPRSRRGPGPPAAPASAARCL